MEYVYNTSSPPLTVNKSTCKCICIWMNELTLHELNKVNTTTIYFWSMKFTVHEQQFWYDEIVNSHSMLSNTNTKIQKQKRFCFMII